MNQLHLSDRPAADSDPVDPSALHEKLQRVQAEGKSLSRLIGAAKASGEDIQALLQRRGALSIEEQTLIEAIRQHTSPPALPVLRPCRAATSVAVSAVTPLPPTREPVQVALLTDAQADAWDRYVEQHPHATSYHLSGWRAVCFKAFGHRSHHVLATRAGEVVGVLPLVQLTSSLFGNFLVSMPFLNYGGVLADDEAARSQLLDHAVKQAQALGCSHMELRETRPSATWPMRTDKVSMWLPLPTDKEALWAQLGSKLRAQIKKGLGNGLSFEVGDTRLLDDFYRVFSTNMRDLGTPVYDKAFFEIVLRQAPGRPELVVGRNAQGKPVAAALVLRHGTRMEVPWASTIRQANGLNANMALYWTMLSHACDAGCATFDFGRSTVDASTHRFKKQWKAREVPLFWHYWMADGRPVPQINPGNPKYRLAISVWKRLPTAIANRIGPPIARALP